MTGALQKYHSDALSGIGPLRRRANPKIVSLTPQRDGKTAQRSIDESPLL
jgi:hypothetical protein